MGSRLQTGQSKGSLGPSRVMGDCGPSGLASKCRFSAHGYGQSQKLEPWSGFNNNSNRYPILGV